MSQKTPIGASIGKMARARALSHIHNTGKALPATVRKVRGSIMQVQFEVDGGYTLPTVTVPLFGPEYSRYPMQVGDKGVLISADAPLGHMSGLGPEKAPGLSRPGNLSPLVFLPVGNDGWPKVDPNKIVNYGKGGAQLRDKDGKAVLDADGSRGFGFGFGKPAGYNAEDIKPGEYDHSIAGGSGGLASKSKAKITSTADDNIEHTTQKRHKVTATEGVDITTPLASLAGNMNVSGTMQAALAALGGIGGIGGGAVPGNLSMAGNIAGANVSTPGAVTAGLLNGSALRFGNQRVTPATGATVALTVPMTFVDPPGALAALTLDFPSSPTAGDIVCAAFTREVTTLTCAGGTFGANNPASVSAGGAQFRWMFSGGKWLLW